MKIPTKLIDNVSMVLCAVGGIAWGLATFGIDLVNMLFDGWSKVVYALVGLATLWLIWKGISKRK